MCWCAIYKTLFSCIISCRNCFCFLWWWHKWFWSFSTCLCPIFIFHVYARVIFPHFFTTLYFLTRFLLLKFFFLAWINLFFGQIYLHIWFWVNLLSRVKQRLRSYCTFFIWWFITICEPNTFWGKFPLFESWI